MSRQEDIAKLLGNLDPVLRDLAKKSVQHQWYVLDAKHQPVAVDDLIAWAQFFENNEARRVAETRLNGLRVSTVFLGLDHSWSGKPLFFETMIFRDGQNPPPAINFERIKDWAHDYQMRYATWDEAVAGHEQIITVIREGLV